MLLTQTAFRLCGSTRVSAEPAENKESRSGTAWSGKLPACLQWGEVVGIVEGVVMWECMGVYVVNTHCT